jgi:hypothetical protein
MADEKPNERSAEARRILERVHGETASGGLLGRAGARARDHLGARDVDPSDRIEVWGTRIGRVLGPILLVALVVWTISQLAGVQ